MDEALLSRLRRRLAERPSGPFHFPELYGPDWDDLWIGDRVQLGHQFLNAVRAGKLPGVDDTGQKKGGGRLYRWQGL